MEERTGYRAPLAQRYWSYVDMRGPDECWPWTAGTNNGYGRIWDGSKMAYATRVGWELAHGESPGDLDEVRHTCDNPPCQNPAHWELGPHDANMRDMVERGRLVNVRGEQHGKAKLTDDRVREIVALRGDGLTLKDIAVRVGVHYATVQQILLGATWAHITGLPRINRLAPVPHRKRDFRGAANNLSKLTEEEVRAIHAMRREGKTQREIADHFSVGQTAISRILTGARWGHLMQ